MGEATRFRGAALSPSCVPSAPRARRERYFEFPLLERYLTCKQHAHSLVFIYILRNLLLLLFLAATCLYLVFLHLNIFFQDEFSCSIKTGLLQEEPHIPPLIPCKLVFFSVFQLISLSVGGVYVLLMPVVIYNALQLCQWDKGLLSVYEMLPAFDLLSRKMLTCPVNDLNVILLFLRANISELTSFGRLNAVSALREATANKEDIDTVVDFMTLLAGLETTKPKHHACSPEADGSAPLSNGGAPGRLFFFWGREDLFALLLAPPQPDPTQGVRLDLSTVTLNPLPRS